MPTVIIPFPTPSGGVASAIVKTGHKRTVRFVRREPRRETLPPSPAHSDQRLIDGARLTALNYRRFAEKAERQDARANLLRSAEKWDARAEELTRTMHGPQQPAGELFG